MSDDIPFDEPFVAIGNDQLGGPIERRIKCPYCDDFHAVVDSEAGESRRYGPDENGEWVWTTEPGTPGLLQTYTCDMNGKSYLVGIQGRAIQ